MPSPVVIDRPDAKESGAYYTDRNVAEFLVRWAVRGPDDHVLDPSSGGGVFLAAAARRIAELGGAPAKQVCGVELNEEAFADVRRSLGRQFGPLRLHQGDFFEFDSVSATRLAKKQLGGFDAVVGNPPFIRYQRFTGQARANGLRRAAEEGVVLPQLSSSWAPFLVHSAAMLMPGGRLAMVLPYELVYARYAKPVLNYLAAQFAHVTLLTFDQPLFPEVNEATVLLLAEGKCASGSGKLLIKHLDGPRDLLAAVHSDETRSSRIDARALVDGEERFDLLHLPLEYREVYAAARRFCGRLGSIAGVGIGYVTGANDFFHVTPENRVSYALPDAVLARTVCRGSALRGAIFTDEDWAAALPGGGASYLLRLDGESDLAPVQRYLRAGQRQGIAQRYKCRSRKPWYRVPNVYQADAFLTYMSGDRPRLVVNEAGVFAPNTLHVVRMRGHDVRVATLAILWQTSIALLSAQLEGHAMGGGMLKLEPREAERILLPLTIEPHESTAVLREIDALLRSGRGDDARHLADDLTLVAAGFTRSDCDRLARAAELLVRRRCSRISAHADR
jgi:tRNA1(Val) A37 N6-methylase TrmN6